MNRAIASLAIVKTAFTRYKKDYIENFVPFVATLMKKKRYSDIDCTNLKPFINDFKEEFGLIIPYHPMLTILERTRKRGIVKRSYSKLTPDHEKILKYDFSDIALKKEAELNEVLGRFVTFCQDKYSISITQEEAQIGLISFLRNHDLDLLFASQDKSLLPTIKASRQMKYLLADFINETHNIQPQVFNSIIEVCVGYVLANTILYAENFAKFKGKLRNLELYLDTRFILRFLGIEGELYRGVYTDLALSINEQNAKLFIFRHTFDEIMGIFRSCLKWISHSEYDPTKASSVLQYFIANSKNESDIHQYIVNIETRLDEYNISIKDSPNFTLTPEFQIDENTLREHIIDVYSRSLYFDETEKQATINRDIKSISSIFHLRRGRIPQTIKQAGVFFVTTNGTLAAVCMSFERELAQQQFHIPVCVTDTFIGTLIWMQSPVKWASLNEKKFIADCLASLQPDALFVKKLILEATKLKESGRIDDDEFLAVSRSYFIQDMLMQKTLGDSESISAERIEDILQKIKSDSAYIPEQQLKREKEKRQQLESQISVYEHSIRERDSRLELNIRRIVDVLFNFVFILSIILLIASVVFPFFAWIKSPWKIIFIILAIFFGIFSIGYGFNFKGLKTKMVMWSISKVMTWFH